MAGCDERLVSLLVDLCDQLELGHRRAQEALLEVRMGDIHSHRNGSCAPVWRTAVAEHFTKQPQPAAGDPPQDGGSTRQDGGSTRQPPPPRRTRQAGHFLSTSSAGSCSDSVQVLRTGSAPAVVGPAQASPPGVTAAPRSFTPVQIRNQLRAIMGLPSTEQPPPAPGEPQERPRRTLPAGCFNSAPSAVSGGAEGLGASALPPTAEAPCDSSRQPSGATGPDGAGRGRQPLRFVENNCEDPAPQTVGASPKATPTRSSRGDKEQSVGASPMMASKCSLRSLISSRPGVGSAPRRPSARSMWSTARSMFGGSNQSMSPVTSQSGATSAMEMIEHDSVRSFDLKPFWRQTSPKRLPQFYAGTRSSSYMITSRMPWPVRKWLSRFDFGPSLTQCRVKELVTSTRYEVCVMLLIMANSVFLGYQVEHEARTRRQLQRTLEIEAGFCVVFTLELAVKLYAMSWSFFVGSEASWNYFDISVVMLMLLDFFASVAQSTAESSLWSQGQVLRVLRVLRVVRFLRSVRQLKFFMQLRIMIRSIMFSLRPLLWATIVLLGMFYVFGIILTQGVIDSLREHDSWDDASSAELRTYFGTLGSTALSLFQAMSGGVNWGELFEALSPLALHFKFVFLFFVLFAIFGAANVVTGIFVEIANHWARNDKASQEQEATEKRVTSIKRLHELFVELDPGGHGTLTFESMHEALLDVNNNLVSSFHALDLEVTDVRTLFLLLDRDRKGFINMEEFLLGCFRLKGEAKTLDVMKLQYQCEWMMHNMVNMLDIITGRDAWDQVEATPHHGAENARGTGLSHDVRDFPAMVANQQLAQLGQVGKRNGSQHTSASPRSQCSREGSPHHLVAHTLSLQQITMQSLPVMSKQNTLQSQPSANSNC